MKGVGVARDYRLGLSYYEQSADQHFGPAESALGQCYEFGFGVESNLVRAVEYYERAVSDEDMDGCYRLGLCFEFGRGVDRDLSRACECYQRGASADHVGCLNCYGFCLENGVGIVCDLGEAAAVYERSCEKGDAVGLFHFALCNQYGRGVEVDLECAAEYYLRLSLCGGMRESSGFRCRRTHGSAEFSCHEFHGLLDAEHEMLCECRLSRPRPHESLREGFVLTGSPGGIPICRLGSGGSSTVDLVRSRDGDRHVVKYVDVSSDSATFIREIEALSSLNHVCVVRMLGYVLPDEKNRAEIHLEHASGGSLEHILRDIRQDCRPSFWTNTTIGIVLSGVVLGLRYIHGKGFVHQDLKPSNILISGQHRALIADFGAARSSEVDSTPDGVCGTIQYASPEQLEELVPTTKTDVFSFGLVVYEVVVGRAVFPLNESPFSIIRKLRSGYVPPIPDYIFGWVGSLIVQCLSADPAARPSFEDILEMMKRNDFSFLEGVDTFSVRSYVEAVEAWEGCNSI
jgi:hypothetical protein